MADATNAFSKHGVSVAMSYIPGTKALAALLSHDVDALEQAPAPMIIAKLNGEVDAVFLAGVLNRSTYSLYVRPVIRTAADLRGKVLASDRPGSTNDFGMRMALSLLGQPGEVTVLPLGAADVGYASLVAGKVDGAILTPPQSFQAEAKGFKSLQDTFNVPYQNTGIVALRSRLDELRPALTAFFPAYREGVEAFRNQPDQAMQVIEKFTQESDRVILSKTYEFYRSSAPFEPSLEPTVDGLRAVLASLADTIPAAKGAKPEEFLDLRFVAAARR